MGLNLTESIVWQHLRDHPGEVRCADCLARDLGWHSSSAIARILTQLAERRPPFAAGRCGCRATGLMYVLM
jgi:hypothetical protein